MFAEIKALIEKRANLADQAAQMVKDIGAESRDFTSEEDEKFERIHKDVEKISRQIERLEKQRELDQSLAQSQSRAGAQETDISEPTAEPEVRINDAFDHFLRRGPEGLNEREAAALGARRPQNGRAVVELGAPEIRALSVSTSTQGVETVPEGFWPALIESRLAFGGMRQARTFVFSTATGNDLPVPTTDDTSNTGELLGENTEVNEQDVAFSSVTLNAYKYSSKAVRVPVELLEDSAFDIGAFLGRALGTRIGRITNTHFTTGTGSSQPNGVVTASSSGKTAASATAVTYLELLDLKHSVDPAYRAGAEWMFNDATLLALKKLVDGDSRPVWSPGMTSSMAADNSAAATIDGDRFVVNQDVASIGASAKPILYGDFSQYWIRDVAGFRLLRLSERYAEFDQVGFMAFSRHDADLIDAGTDPIKFITMAAS